uniref:Uncharacterized protein n=1 Tax=Ditylenchus dipsaci TaxID=166011 RepID=A0A915DDV1_9BILA
MLIYKCQWVQQLNLNLRYSVCNVERGEIILKHSLISSSEIVQISNLDGTLSRFKDQAYVPKPVKENGACIVEEFRPAEREIAQRATNPNVLSGETSNSLVKVMQIFRCSLTPSSALETTYLWAPMVVLFSSTICWRRTNAL